jgi:hypothetical protein
MYFSHAPITISSLLIYYIIHGACRYYFEARVADAACQYTSRPSCTMLVLHLGMHKNAYFAGAVARGSLCIAYAGKIE